jgi:hypothetical protein
MISPLTGQAQVYFEHYTLAAYQAPTPVASDSLKTYINNQIASSGYDSWVDEVKFIKDGAGLTNVQCRMWVAGSSPVDPITIMALIALIVLAISAVAVTWLIATSAQSVIEHFWPQSKFYQMAKYGAGDFRPVELNSQAEYVSCQRAAYPDGHVCPYCGQVFMASQYGPPNDASAGTYATDADALSAEQAHEKACPWKGGVPGAPPSWMGLVVFGVGAVVVVTGIWGATKVLSGRRLF